MLLIAPTYLADHDEVRGRRVFFEQLDDVPEGQPEHGVATDADDGRLAHPGSGERRRDLVGKRAAARNETDGAARGDVLRNDPDLADDRRDLARAGGPDEPRHRMPARES